MVAGLENVGGFGAGHHRTNRHTRAQSFGQWHHVRHNARPLVGKPLAGAAHAALHFVNHHQPVALVTQGAQLAQIVQVHRIDAAFTLDSLKKYRHHIGVVGGGSLQCLDVVDRHTNEALDQRAKASLDLGVTGGTQGGNASAMKGFFIDHNFGALDAFVVAKFARQFQGRLVGFQSCGAEKHIRHAGERHQLFRQRLLQGDMVVIAAVDDLANLVLQRGHQFGVVVAQRVDGNAAECVQVTFAVDVPHAATLAVAERHGQTPIGVHHVRGTGFGRVGGNSHGTNLRWASTGNKQSGPTQVGPLKSDFRPIKLAPQSCPFIWGKLVLRQSFWWL